MYYGKLQWVKLSIELLTDDRHRFLFQLSDSEQLLYLKLLLLAGKHGNNIPYDLNFIKNSINYHNSLEQLELEILNIQKTFPKLVKDANLLYFSNFVSYHKIKYGMALEPLNDIRDKRLEIRDKRIETVAVATPPEYLSEVNNYWNLKHPNKNLRYLSDKRKKKLRARWQEEAWRDGWRGVIDKLAASDFCNGKNDRGWVASFDWLIENDNNYVKVLEGRYDNRTAPAAQPFRQSL